MDERWVADDEWIWQAVVIEPASGAIVVCEVRGLMGRRYDFPVIYYSMALNVRFMVEQVKAPIPTPSP